MSTATATLNDVMDYRNDEVVLKFQLQYGFTLEECEEIFMEMKRWLWFAANADLPSISMYHSLALVDDMWHMFITFTRDYAEFCEKHFGRFMHHEPTPEAEKKRARHDFEVDPEDARARWSESLRLELDEALRLLGEDTLRTWFVDFPLRYSASTCRDNLLTSLGDVASDQEVIDLVRRPFADDLQRRNGADLVSGILDGVSHRRQEKCSISCGSSGGSCKTPRCGVGLPK